MSREDGDCVGDPSSAQAFVDPPGRNRELSTQHIDETYDATLWTMLLMFNSRFHDDGALELDMGHPGHRQILCLYLHYLLGISSLILRRPVL